ncbi:MAG TPA: hypothetical protein VFR85_04440 [Anaeromyxobacteraceae bacterium]|nr:hypothetical protein [Anaeromyxobacteraceae bacterium]
MKSGEVSGAIPPQVCHTQADVAGQGAAGGLATRVAKAAAAAGASKPAALQRAASRSPGEPVQEAARTLSLLRPQAARAWVIEPPARHALTVSGYAPAPAAAVAAASTGATVAAAGSSTSSKGEWAFLDDRRLSIEDKLFMFMKLVMKKSNDELEKKMKEYQAAKARGTSSSSSGAKKPAGGLFGVLSKAFPPLAALAKAIPALPDLVNKLATQLGPQLLGALMIPLGAPWAAPLVQRAASELLPAAISTLDGGASASSTASTSSTGGSGDDERMQLLEIERMMQKTNQMFATISNVLKATHDAAMTAVNNIR